MTQRRPADPLRISFSATGYDDRDYHLEWLPRGRRRIGSWIEIEVADELTPAPLLRGPKRRRRNRINWDKFFARMRARDIRKIATLEARLRRVRAGSPYEAPLWPLQKPACALRILRNGRKFAEVSVNRPGTLHVSIIARARGKRRNAVLRIHGGDYLGRYTNRWYVWPRVAALKVGDRVRILVVKPRANVKRRVRSLDCSQPSSAEEIVAKLASLRADLRSDFHGKEAAYMRAFPARLPPHRYAFKPRRKPAGRRKT